MVLQSTPYLSGSEYWRTEVFCIVASALDTLHLSTLHVTREFWACVFTIHILSIGTPVLDLSPILLKIDMESCFELSVFVDLVYF